MTETKEDAKPAPKGSKGEGVKGIDPFTGEDVDVAEAQRTGQPVMKPESQGDLSDITNPTHIQAPPDAEDPKLHSSSSERRRELEAEQDERAEKGKQHAELEAKGAKHDADKARDAKS